MTFFFKKFIYLEHLILFILLWENVNHPISLIIYLYYFREHNMTQMHLCAQYNLEITKKLICLSIINMLQANINWIQFTLDTRVRSLYSLSHLFIAITPQGGHY